MGGGPISRHGAISTSCGRFVLAPAGAALRVYSCSSNSTLTAAAGKGDGNASCSAAGTLVCEMIGHDADVTAVSRYPDNDEQVSFLKERGRERGIETERRRARRETRHCRRRPSSPRHFVNASFDSFLAIPNRILYLQVYTSSLDGTVRLWAWATGECLEVFKVGVPITGMVSFFFFLFFVRSFVVHLAAETGNTLDAHFLLSFFFSLNSLPQAVPPRTSLAYLSTSWAEGSSGRIMRLKLSSGQLEPERFKLSAAGGRLALSAGGGVVVALERRTLWAWRAAAPSLRKPLTLSGSKGFCCAAVDGDDDRLAVGDASGRVTVWRGLTSALAAAASAAAASAAAAVAAAAAEEKQGGEASKRHPRRRLHSPPSPSPPSSKLLPPLTLHWHSSAVRALCFSPDGELLLSGGSEGVLVWWRLDACAASVAGGVTAAASAARGFLPRLGGPITSLDAVRGRANSFEGSCVLSQADNTIRRVNLATVEVEASVHGLRPRATSSSFSSSVVDPFDAASPTAALCPLSSAPGDLVVAVPGSALQFWSSARDAHARRLPVSHRNDVTTVVASSSSSSSASADDAASAAANNSSSATPRVTGVAFSGDGRGMATAEAVPRPGAAGAFPSSASASVSPSLTGRAGALKLWASSSSGVSVAGQLPYALVAEVVDPHR